MKFNTFALSVMALLILLLLRLTLSQNFVTLNRFWWLLGLYAIIIFAFNFRERKFYNAVIVTSIILLLLFRKLPLPYEWLTDHKVYFSLNLLFTAIAILAYCYLGVILFQKIVNSIKEKRLHT